MHDENTDTTPTEGDDPLFRGNQGSSAVGIRERTEIRIHRVLTVYEGDSVGLMHTSVGSYNRHWRSVFEAMIVAGEIRREVVMFDNRTHQRHYTNKPQGEVTVVS